MNWESRIQVKLIRHNRTEWKTILVHPVTCFTWSIEWSKQTGQTMVHLNFVFQLWILAVKWRISLMHKCDCSHTHMRSHQLFIQRTFSFSSTSRNIWGWELIAVQPHAVFANSLFHRLTFPEFLSGHREISPCVMMRCWLTGRHSCACRQKLVIKLKEQFIGLKHPVNMHWKGFFFLLFTLDPFLTSMRPLEDIGVQNSQS